MTKSIASSDTKELPPPEQTPLDSSETKPIEKQPEVTTDKQDPTSQAPEIKPNTADLENIKDSNIGTSDIKKP